jgi:hypothetical protein
VSRTVYADIESPPVEDLISYILKQKEGLAAQALEDFVRGTVTWAVA